MREISGHFFSPLFFNIKKSIRSSHALVKIVCTLVKMMIIMDDPLVSLNLNGDNEH